jgi:hypothetical protein
MTLSALSDETRHTQTPLADGETAFNADDVAQVKP